MNGSLLPPFGGPRLTTGWNLWPIHAPEKSGLGVLLLRTPPVLHLQAPGCADLTPGPHRGDGAALTSGLALGCGVPGPPRPAGSRKGRSWGRETGAHAVGQAGGVAPLPEARLQLSLWAPSPPRNTARLWVKAPCPVGWGGGHPTAHSMAAQPPGGQFRQEISLEGQRGWSCRPVQVSDKGQT